MEIRIHTMRKRIINPDDFRRFTGDRVRHADTNQYDQNATQRTKTIDIKMSKRDTCLTLEYGSLHYTIVFRIKACDSECSNTLAVGRNKRSGAAVHMTGD